MAQIFISYSTHDRQSAERMAAALATCGWSTWWDRDLYGGDLLQDRIDSEIRQCACVVLLWSSAARESRWVLGEAELGADLGKLVPVRIENVELAAAFRALRAVDLSAWDGATSSAAFAELVRSLEGLLGAAPRLALATRYDADPVERAVSVLTLQLLAVRGRWLWVALLTALSVAVLVAGAIYRPAFRPLSSEDLWPAARSIEPPPRKDAALAILALIVSVRPETKDRDQLEAHPSWLPFLARLAELASLARVRTAMGSLDVGQLQEALSSSSLDLDPAKARELLDAQLPQAGPILLWAFLEASEIEAHDLYGWALQVELAPSLGSLDNEQTIRALTTVLHEVQNPERSRLVPPLVRAARKRIAPEQFMAWFKATLGIPYNEFHGRDTLDAE